MSQIILVYQSIEYEVRGLWGNHGVGIFRIVIATLIALFVWLIILAFKYLVIRSKYKKILARSEDITSGAYKPLFDFKSSDEFMAAIDKNYEQQKEMIEKDEVMVFAATLRVNNRKSDGRQFANRYSRLMLLAFNGEVDSAILKVRWDNVVKMRERIKKIFDAINKLGEPIKTHISEKYLNLRIEELELSYEHQTKLQEEKEEQRRIQEQIREEKKVQEEIETAKKEAEDAELTYQKALTEAKAEIERARGAELEELNNKIKGLEKKLLEAKELKERAISRAQLTKSGFVYVISNVGSFGENIFKIGMTRRLEPLDRIKELGDASVPFEFDVHAMIYSDNAPDLENKLHSHFEKKRVNMVNSRKEFFKVLIDEIEQICKEKNIKIELTKLAEAKEYRETLALKQSLSSS